jgi:hypothetical protein
MFFGGFEGTHFKSRTESVTTPYPNNLPTPTRRSQADSCPKASRAICMTCGTRGHSAGQCPQRIRMHVTHLLGREVGLGLLHSRGVSSD